jgi:archaellum component FlaC
MQPGPEENRMFNNARLIALSLSLMFFGIAGEAIGQVLGQPHRLDDKQVGQIIRRVENQANAFRKSLDESLDKSRLDGTKREDDINAFIKEFDKETARLHDHFDNHKSAGADVEAVLNRAVRIDEFMSRHSLTERPHNEWRTLKANLDELAQAYNVSWRWNTYSPIGSPVSEVPYRPNDKDVEQIIHRIEKQSDQFRASLDSDLDESRIDGTKREDDINAFVKTFYEETKRFHDLFDSRKSTATDVQSVLDRAARIDQFMRRYPLTDKAQNDWSTLRGNLDDLARVYNVTWRWDTQSLP